MLVKKRHPTPADLGLTPAEARVFRKLSNPRRIQAFLYALPANFEENGDTCRSVRSVLRYNKAHCLEAAFFAACALWLNGDPPLLMDLTASGDSDHVVAVYRRDGCWGSISKSNHVWLRWRDPVYRTLRELAMSYFHEYTNNERKTLRGHSEAFDLRRFPVDQWVTGTRHCWEIGAALDDHPHHRLITAAQARNLAPRDSFEMKADELVQHESADRRRSHWY